MILLASYSSFQSRSWVMSCHESTGAYSIYVLSNAVQKHTVPQTQAPHAQTMRPTGSNAASRRNDRDHATTNKSSLTTTSIPSALTKQCLQHHFPGRRFTNEAIELSSEFLKLLVVEARRRAAIEVRS
jgi:hypothetical protein